MEFLIFFFFFARFAMTFNFIFWFLFVFSHKFRFTCSSIFHLKINKLFETFYKFEDFLWKLEKFCSHKISHTTITNKQMIFPTEMKQTNRPFHSTYIHRICVSNKLTFEWIRTSGTVLLFFICLSFVSVCRFEAFSKINCQKWEHLTFIHRIEAMEKTVVVSKMMRRLVDIINIYGFNKSRTFNRNYYPFDSENFGFFAIFF